MHMGYQLISASRKPRAEGTAGMKKGARRAKSITAWSGGNSIVDFWMQGRSLLDLTSLIKPKLGSKTQPALSLNAHY